MAVADAIILGRDPEPGIVLDFHQASVDNPFSPLSPPNGRLLAGFIWSNMGQGNTYKLLHTPMYDPLRRKLVKIIKNHVSCRVTLN
ncbi:unnamed protein product, partial [Dicrocoelium dendriticum]